ncbi:MAG: recombinase RecA [Candidatus Shikimatogenerans sp. AspAUS03]|uniref:Protein RecA n=1 Tax=Candidatus Shikimatogenerans sp. AspAUS03 TaxID=3158563 RepID=A0AAU7QSN9_9FLAO
MNNNNKNNKEVYEIINKIDKQYGKNTIFFIKDFYNSNKTVKIISSGSIKLDSALGILGYPEGRIIEIFGQESSGKTTLALHAILEAQKKGHLCVFIDAEHAFDYKYCKNIGINLSKLILHLPTSGEQALEIVDKLIKSNLFKVIVIDSVSALTPKAEIKGEIGDMTIGLQARLMSQALRKLTYNVYKYKTIVIFLNQIREKIGNFYKSQITSGGNALKFYSSIRLSISKISFIKNEDKIIGNKIIVKIIKNKLFPPFKKTKLYIIYGEGISKEYEILDLGIKFNIIDKKGNWFYFNKINLGNGKENVRKYIKNNINLQLKLLHLINTKISTKRKGFEPPKV